MAGDATMDALNDTLKRQKQSFEVLKLFVGKEVSVDQ